MKNFRLFALTLVAAGALAFWQFAPAPAVQAGPSVDDAIILPNGAPASFADVIEAVQPAVVNISVSGTRPTTPFRGAPGAPGMENFEDFLRRFFERQSYRPSNGSSVVQGMGSGFIVAPEGYVVTNHHVVENASEIAVTMNDGTRYDAELVGSDPKTDLAVLKVDADEPLPYARFGDSDATRVGDWVIAIGNPFGLGGSATTGIISARGRDIQSGPFDDFLQIDAPINRGNSGGPLFDLSGQVIGINAAIYSPNGGNVGIGFAIPSDLASPIIDQLRTSGRVERGWLGVTIQQVNDELADGLGFEGEAGVLVASVVPGSPAERAGLKPGDVITAVEGAELSHIKELTRHVAATKPEEELAFDVWRNGEEMTLDVAVGSSPDETADLRPSAPQAAGPKLGVSLAEITPEARQRFGLDSDVTGALVVAVEPNSSAASKGIRTGDVIVMVGQAPVDGVDAAIDAIGAVKADGRANVLLRVVRDGSGIFVAVPFA